LAPLISSPPRNDTCRYVQAALARDAGLATELEVRRGRCPGRQLSDRPTDPLAFQIETASMREPTVTNKLSRCTASVVPLMLTRPS